MRTSKISAQKEGMMKHIKLFLIAAMAISTATPTLAESPSRWQKVKTFLQKHKRKIAVGIGAAAAIGVTLAAGYHANKTLDALEKAGLSSSDPEFGDAVAVVAFFGPLGEQNTLDLFKRALDKKIITNEQAAALVLSDTGNALAYYFGVSPVTFKAKITKIGITQAARAKMDEVRNGLTNVMNFFKFKK